MLKSLYVLFLSFFSFISGSYYLHALKLNSLVESVMAANFSCRNNILTKNNPYMFTCFTYLLLLMYGNLTIPILFLM